MSASSIDRVFSGSIPQLYEQYLVPLIFETYAVDLADRVKAIGPNRLLEVAAGTGVLTRRLSSTLARNTSIIATDLNQPMLDHAAALGTVEPIQWRQADATKLPFADESFDAVVCQFGVMFFPDKAAAFSEARRVLKPGGKFLFSVWDKIEANEFAETVTSALADTFPTDPPRFLARTPHGYFDRDVIARDLERGGFTSAVLFDTVPRRSRADLPTIPAIAYCQGTPLRSEIEERGPSELAQATETAARAIAARFGTGPIESQIQAHVVVVTR
jgi:ubiquinone/menaquinone biosynthesis C-methylase UbiE